MTPLFDTPLFDTPLFDKPESLPVKDLLTERLHRLAEKHIRIGGSSWKYEGWLDQIYQRERYLTRNKFSKKRFEETCLREYAEVFPTVCGDFAFYQFPTMAFWSKLFAQVPPGFQFGFKVPEQITVPEWPSHARYGAVAGKENHTFLDSRLFEDAFLRAIEPNKKQVGPLIFEFGAFKKSCFPTVLDFVRKLDPFLAQLPTGWRYAIEIRNHDFLHPEYFHCLRAHNVAHVYSAWTRMPELGDQLKIPGTRTADFLVSRALLRKGRNYEQAVQSFQPYTRIQDVNEPARKALRELVDIAIVDGVPAFLFVNNRLEGNSPGTIVAITS